MPHSPPLSYGDGWSTENPLGPSIWPKYDAWRLMLFHSMSNGATCKHTGLVVSHNKLDVRMHVPDEYGVLYAKQFGVSRPVLTERYWNWFSKAGTLCQQVTFRATVFVRSKPVNSVKILPAMFMFLTEKTKTDFAHTSNETILNWHVKLQKNYSKPLRFDETSSADIGWLNLKSSFRKRTLTSWGEKCSKIP